MLKAKNLIKNTSSKLHHIHQHRGVLKIPSNIKDRDFCKNSKGHSVVNCFCKKLHLRRLAGFLIHESGLLKVLNTESKKIEKFNSTEDLYNCEKEGNVFKGNNVASQIAVRLEGKFVSKNVINLSRRNLSASVISLLSKGLKFVSTVNKIDRGN